jgi:hypothetical protein
MQRQELIWSSAYPLRSEAAVQMCTPGSRRWHVRIGLLTLVAQERRLVNLRVRRDQSRRTTLRRELLTFNPPLYSINPSFRNLFMKKLTRERVVPTISARVS